MNINYEIRQEGETLRLRLWDSQGHLLRQSDKVWTGSRTARSLGKSLRHLYRYIQSKTLPPLGKFLREWLFDVDEVHRFKWVLTHCRVPLKKVKLPTHFQVYFPEYQLKGMNPWTNAPLLISRILDQATRQEWKWLFQTFPGSLIDAVVKYHGERLLSPRSYHFWRWLLKIK